MKVDKFGRTVLHHVAVDLPREKHSREIARLISEGYDPNQKDKNGWTPLHFAAQECSLDAVQALLAHGANIDAQDSNGNTPLSEAVFRYTGDGGVVLALLKAGADPEKENAHGASPRSLADTIANYDVRKFFK
ncbi:MAG TPA: ankyrin repeat domain-containing protein [Acidiferrobacterales bacterium]|jgi:ankyrin repeat protein